MPGIENNLYPPIVATWMPAFIRTETCKVYFSLSIYNSKDDIANAQVIINNQSDNRSAFNSSNYSTGIKICNILTDESRTDDKYYIEINPGDLTGGSFGINQFYKVQIRFTKKGVQSPGSSPSASWLTENQKYFSEWSTVCLIKGIEKPNIVLRGFSDTGSTTFHQEIVDIVGNMYFNNSKYIEKETLKSYNIRLYNNDKDKLLYNSGIIYTNTYNPNEINYTLKVHLENAHYRLVLRYTTVNEYTDSVTYTFLMSQNLIDPLSVTIEATPDTENGRMKISITGSGSFSGDLIIRRASNEDNYTIWEDVHQTKMNNQSLNYIWYDYTVESGVLYKYGAQQKNGSGQRGELITTKPILINLDDMFLTRANMQFRIKFDPNVSNFKYTYSEIKIDTLGAQYPYFYRNGNVKYRQFSISGLITSWCDEEGIFLNKTNIYKDSEKQYSSYNKEENITEYQDYIYERKFREKIIDFLYADDIKLFRSPTEGNILVRLMDISLTPNQTLGRMLYSFTANAYEIDECSIDNFQKYGILSIDKT